MHTETHDQNLTPDSPALLHQTDLILARIHTLLGDQGIRPNEVQKQMLASHVKAMVWRSHSGESLPEVDLSLFDEISPFPCDWPNRSSPGWTSWPMKRLTSCPSISKSPKKMNSAQC